MYKYLTTGPRASTLPACTPTPLDWDRISHVGQDNGALATSTQAGIKKGTSNRSDKLEWSQVLY